MVRTSALYDNESWLTASSPFMLRCALGIVFLWFGVLKFFPGLSPAGALAGKTISALTAGYVAPSVSVPVLAAWESFIGLGLLLCGPRRIFLIMLLLEMPGTMLPFVFFPHETFTHVPFVPTLEGQYIIKNLVLIAGACALLKPPTALRLTAAELRPPYAAHKERDQKANSAAPKGMKRRTLSSGLRPYSARSTLD